MCASANEESYFLVNNAPLTRYEPKFFDDYHFSETTEIFIQESSSDSRPLNSHDLDVDDYTIGRALSSPLFTQERQEPAGCRQAYHSLEESLLSSQSLSVGPVLTIDPFIRISVFIAKLSERQYCWRVFEDFLLVLGTFTLKHANKSGSCVRREFGQGARLLISKWLRIFPPALLLTQPGVPISSRENRMQPCLFL